MGLSYESTDSSRPEEIAEERTRDSKEFLQLLKASTEGVVAPDLFSCLSHQEHRGVGGLTYCFESSGKTDIVQPPINIPLEMDLEQYQVSDLAVQATSMLSSQQSMHPEQSANPANLCFHFYKRPRN